jgi:hypothetical protein
MSWREEWREVCMHGERPDVNGAFHKEVFVTQPDLTVITAVEVLFRRKSRPRAKWLSMLKQTVPRPQQQASSSFVHHQFTRFPRRQTRMNYR